MLAGKNIVVTGCNRGIGFAVLKCCAENGANIWACMRKPNEDVELELKEISKKNNVRIECVYFDLTSENEIIDATKQILKSKLQIDGIVNNAGMVGKNRLFSMTSLDDIRMVFEANFFGPLLFTQKLIKNMIRNRSGSIVNISSAAAVDAEPAQLEYVSSKAAIMAASKRLSKELGAFGIRVNSILPGVTKTDMLNNMENSVLEAEKEKNSLNVIGEPIEIAEMVAFLLSDKCKYLTGQGIRIDGGRI